MNHAHRLSIVMPSTGRPQLMRAAVLRFAETLEKENVDVEFSLAIDHDPVSYDIARGMRFDDGTTLKVSYSRDYQGVVKACNRAYKQSTGNVVLLAADDLWPHDGWWGPAIEAFLQFPDTHGVVGLNDLIRPGGEPFTTVCLLTRHYIEEHQGGWIASPEYWSGYIDTEMCEKAKGQGRYIFSEASVIEHRHWTNGKRPHDATYHLSDGWYQRDNPTYEKRKAAGFPTDYSDEILREALA